MTYERMETLIDPHTKKNIGFWINTTDKQTLINALKILKENYIDK